MRRAYFESDGQDFEVVLRSRALRWQGRIRRVAEAASGARLLPVAASIVATGTTLELASRRKRLEAWRGALVQSVVSEETRTRDCLCVWTDRRYLQELRHNEVAVPAATAAAALARVIEPRRTVAVYWSDGKDRLVVNARRGRLVAPTLQPRQTLLLTPPNRSQALPPSLSKQPVVAGFDKLPRLTPLALLAVGAAIAGPAGTIAPGLASQAHRPMRRYVRKARLVVLAALLVGSVGALLDALHQLAALREQLSRERQQLEEDQYAMQRQRRR